MKKLVNKLKGIKEPRALDDIRKEYSEVSGRAAAANYQVFIYQGQAVELHARMKELNEEAAERNRLNAEAAKAQKEAPNVKA